METLEPEEEETGGEYKLPRGALAAFVDTLTPEQKRLWRPVRRAIKAASARAAARALQPREPKDQLYDAVNEATGKVTVEQIEDLIENAVANGNVQALRVMAQMAGMDLTERPKEPVGPGAKVIIIRPKPLVSLTAAREEKVRAGVNAGASGSGPVVL